MLLNLLALFANSCAVLDSDNPLLTKRRAALRKQLNVNVAHTLKHNAKRDLFSNYRKNSQSVWSKGWAQKLNLSGVAWNGAKAGVLVTPQHVLMATHHQRRAGEKLVFHDLEGAAHARKLIKIIELPGELDPDISVGLLNKAVPVTPYRVLSPRTLLHHYDADLKGCYALFTHANRRLSVVEIAGLAFRRVLFRQSKTVPKEFKEKIVRGDSGHPIFLLLQDELALLSMHSFGGNGAGPFLSESQNFSEINQAIAALGGPWSLQTRSLPLLQSARAQQVNKPKSHGLLGR